jgi:hypothetical protein
MDHTEIKRSELYRLVWETPMSRLAKTYRLSDVGLAKICRKHNIPRPPRGYWARKQFGYAPRQVPLPSPDKDEQIVMWNANKEASMPDELQDETARMIAAEQTKERQIVVAETLRGSHELVHQANQELQAADSDRDGVIVRPEKATLNVVVSKGSLRRALLIIDALIRALESRGHAVAPGPLAQVTDVKLSFGIHEPLATKREHNDDVDLEGSYRFGHSRYDVKRVPSGRLVLQIGHEKAYWCTGVRRVWRDTEKRRLENQLNKVVAGMIELAARVKQYEEQQAREAEKQRQEEARRQEAARVRSEKRKLQKAEQARLDELLRLAENWQTSQKLRNLIDAVRQLHSLRGPIEPGSEIARWIDWATLQADRFDPLRPSPTSILDEKIEEEPEPRYGLGRSW